MADSESVLSCPSCESPVPVSATFCVLCGAVISRDATRTRALADTPPDPLALPLPRVVRPTPPTPAPPKAPPSPAPRAPVAGPSPATPLAAPPPEPVRGELAPLVAAALALATFILGVHWLASRQPGRTTAVATVESPSAHAAPRPSSGVLSTTTPSAATKL